MRSCTSVVRLLDVAFWMLVPNNLCSALKAGTGPLVASKSEGTRSRSPLTPPKVPLTIESVVPEPLGAPVNPWYEPLWETREAVAVEPASQTGGSGLC